MVEQKEDESILEIDREVLFNYIETKEFLAVIFCKYKNQLQIQQMEMCLKT